MLFCNNSSNILVEQRRHITGILCKIHYGADIQSSFEEVAILLTSQSVLPCQSVADMSITGDVVDLFRDFIPVLTSEFQ